MGLESFIQLTFVSIPRKLSKINMRNTAVVRCERITNPENNLIKGPAGKNCECDFFRTLPRNGLINFAVNNLLFNGDCVYV